MQKSPTADKLPSDNTENFMAVNRTGLCDRSMAKDTSLTNATSWRADTQVDEAGLEICQLQSYK